VILHSHHGCFRYASRPLSYWFRFKPDMVCKLQRKFRKKNRIFGRAEFHKSGFAQRRASWPHGCYLHRKLVRACAREKSRQLFGAIFGFGNYRYAF